jgi:hypothetical protein
MPDKAHLWIVAAVSFASFFVLAPADVTAQGAKARDSRESTVFLHHHGKLAWRMGVSQRNIFSVYASLGGYYQKSKVHIDISGPTCRRCRRRQ